MDKKLCAKAFLIKKTDKEPGELSNVRMMENVLENAQIHYRLEDVHFNLLDYVWFFVEPVDCARATQCFGDVAFIKQREPLTRPGQAYAPTGWNSNNL